MSDRAGPSGLELGQAVYALARLVPAGSVLAYKDVAELLGAGGPRQVGKAMSQAPAGLPWWRVLRSDGGMADPLAERARQHWEQEGLPLRGTKVRIDQARWKPTEAQWRSIDALAARVAEGKSSDPDGEL
ncbi:MGMT family protein [Glutamicibacter sp. PS]|uniref:MGMT family protein n=1 Tax=Glutamicibacter TaxID=1742989 RepID=UPI00284EDB31|nr:MGMT family protein [Glutamicibacter sp. PS]MDR4532354.1 MGMT family protein [Glutamicibacter sp. PS]